VTQSLSATPVKAAPTHDRLAWRTWVPWALVVLAMVVGLVSALNIWVKRQALSTDNWTNTSAQLLQNDKVRSALSVYLVDQLYENVDVAAALEQRLPPQFKGLAPPLAGALQGVAVQRTNTFLGRPRVQELWREANRRAHKLFIAVLDGKHNLLVSTNGDVVLDLRALVEQVGAQIGLSGKIAQRLPPDAGRIVIMKDGQLDTARKTVKVIRVLSYLLFFLVLALYAAAVFLARGRRRRLLMASGVSVLLVGLIVLAVRRYAGSYLVDALTTNADDKRAVSASWAIGTDLLRNTGINAVVYGLGIMFAAWIAGPARLATWLRRSLAPTMHDRPVVVYGAVAFALLLVLITGPTDAQRILPLLILFGFAFVGTAVLRRQVDREFPAPGRGRG
jgi:hypothetical protein